MSAGTWCRRLVWAGLVLSLLGGIAYRQHDRLGPTEVRKDSRHNLTMAWQLARHGVLSLDPPGTEEPQPTAYREPGYPAVVALVLATWPPLARAGHDRVLAPFRRAGRELDAVKVFQIGLLVLLALLAGVAAWRLTGSPWTGCLALALVGFSPALGAYAHRLVPELLVALLLLACCLLFRRAWLRPGPMSFGALAVGLGLLTLCRAIYWYAGPLVLLFLLVVALRRSGQRRRLLAATGLFVAVYLALVGAWLGRNYAAFGQLVLTERGGVVLDIRAEYDTMTAAEYKASFVFWAQCPDALRGQLHRFHPDDFLRLSRANPEGCLRVARARREQLRRELGDSKAADRAQLAQAKQRILDNFGRHLLVTLPIAWKGSFVEEPPWCLASYLLWSVFLGVLVVGACRRRHRHLLIFALPALYHVAFYSGLTHNIPRYNAPLLPVLWVLVAVAAGGAGRRGWRRLTSPGAPD